MVVYVYMDEECQTVVPPAVVLVRGEGVEGVWPPGEGGCEEGEGEEGGDWLLGERVTDRRADSCKRAMACITTSHHVRNLTSTDPQTVSDALFLW